MIIKGFGCSFIYGSELADDRYHEPGRFGSRLVWPALLAKDCGYEYNCYAFAGVGNLYIAEQVLNQCASNNPAIFIINWSFIDRFDYFDPELKSRLDPDNHQEWLTCRPHISISSEETVNDLYYRNFHSEYRDKLTTLMSIKICIDTLKQQNIKFLMTYMDPLMFDTKWNVSPAVLSMQEYIRPYCTEFNGKNFVEYGRDLGHQVTHSGHILESGHQAIFEYVKLHNLV